MPLQSPSAPAPGLALARHNSSKITFHFATVNDPSDPGFTRVTGVNQLGKIVGYYLSGHEGGTARGFSSEPPYVKFRGINYPSGIETYPTSLSSNYSIAGYFITKALGPKETWMFIYNHGLFTLYKDKKGPSGAGMVDELLGFNDSNTGVGFYKDSNGHDVPFQFTPPQKFVALHPPNAVSAQATAINGKGDMAGFETLSSGKTQSFVLISGVYTTFNYPNAVSTEALGLNWQDQVVGQYTDASGKTYGFVLSDPNKPPKDRTWQQVVEPNAKGVTVVNCINNHDEIVGWYVDDSGDTNGFLGKP